MSPEQLFGREVDHRTDLFSIAVMIAEVLTGRAPFEDDTHALLAQTLSYESFRLPGSTSQARALSDLLRQSLSVDPRDRASSAESFRDAVIPMLRDCPPLGVATLA